MHNFDFNSKKYTILLILICLGFTIITIKAFEYLPARLTPNDIAKLEQIGSSDELDNNADSSSVNENSDDEQDDEEDIEYKKRHKKGHIDFSKGYDEEPEFDEIQAPKGAIEEELPSASEPVISAAPSNEDAVKYYLNAKKLLNDKNYSEALKEFQKVAQSTDDKELKAMACESIAEIYVMHKRYGTALAFANKAYSLSPTNSRELLIARINYKSGNVDSAISEMNNMLKKDF